jgi:[ribosomal protein S18]-alanine N-acetyltransferase
LHPTLRFVPLTKDLINSILEIENVTHSAPWSFKSFENELDHKHGIFKVLLIDGKVAGYGGTWVLIDEAHVTNVVIRSDLRGMGLGRQLMVELLYEAKKRGALCATLEVRSSNQAAIKLYDSLGFSEVLLRKKYYPDNEEDAIVMFLNELQDWTNPS